MKLAIRYPDSDEGRDPATIEKTIIGGGDPGSDPDGFLSSMERYAALGIDQVWVMASDADDRAGWVTRVCETVLPRLAEL